MRLYTAKHWIAVLLVFCALSAACVVWIARLSGASWLTGVFVLVAALNVANTLFSIFVPLVIVEGRSMSTRFALLRRRQAFSLDDVTKVDRAGVFWNVTLRDGSNVALPQRTFSAADRERLAGVLAI